MFAPERLPGPVAVTPVTEREAAPVFALVESER